MRDNCEIEKDDGLLEIPKDTRGSNFHETPSPIEIWNILLLWFIAFLTFLHKYYAPSADSLVM